jgi:adenylylsulfate reductase subunit B
MSILINREKCTGCGKCIKVCPGTLLFKEMDDSKAYIKYPKECWGCTSCLKECKFEAISYYQGADIGGNGTTMYVTEEGNELHWHITDAGGNKKIISIDRTKANSY